LVQCEKEDLNIYADDDNIEITCGFTDLPSNLTLDSTSVTSLEQEYLVNLEGDLEIKKVYKASINKPKPKVYIVCNYPIESPYNNILNLKQKELRDLAKELDIDTENYNANNNASIRKALFNNKLNLDFQLQEIEIDKGDAKKVYEVLEKSLPIYSLFQSDRSSRDNDKEVADPMSIAVKEALRELEAELDNIKNKVKEHALETANRTLSKLQEMDKDLATSLIPEFKTDPKFDSQFKLTIQSEDGISVNKRGSGVRRLILLNFFRAEVERKMKEDVKENVIYAFEEPETSQHPKHQEMLIESFLQLSNNTNSQIFLTTHTPALAGMLPLTSLRFITKENNERVVKSNDNRVFERVSETLGVLPEPFPQNTRALLLVEGQGDVVFIDHLCNELKKGNSIPYTLKEKGFAIIPTGGCGNLKSWNTLKLAEQFRVPWCVLLDSDLSTPEAVKNDEMVKELKKSGIKAYLTKKREPENYLHANCFETKVEFNDTDDAKLIINRETRTSKSKVLEKYWPKMTFDQIKEMEKYISDDGEVRYEFTEMINDFLTLVE
ncbi:lantibiotic ABC transporter, partial [Staphylococcus simulans]